MHRQMHRSTHQSKVPGGVSFCHTAKFCYLNGSWFLLFLEFCHSGTGVVSSALSPSFMGSELVDLVESGLFSSHCSGAVNMLSSK